MRPAPGIARERRSHRVLGLGLYGEHDAVLVGERPAEDDEPLVDEPVHEGRVRGPVGLLLERTRAVPAWPGTKPHDKEHRHPSVLAVARADGRTAKSAAVRQHVGALARAALVTTVVGSYPQPDWLIDRERLGERLPPRVRARELWRVPEPFLEQAQDDATRLAVQDMERAGVDVITDGEMRRESYSNRFATALDGIDLDDPGVALDRTGHENPVPRVVGPIRRTGPVETRDVAFLRSLTDRRIKITVPGPFTMTQQAQNDYYRDDRSLALAYADAVNDELRDLKAAGADVVQIDEPYLQARPEAARRYAIEAIDRALDGIDGDTVLHTCFGYAAIVHDRPSGYPFLHELDDCAATHISIEAAQPDLDPAVLRGLADKVIVLGVLDLGAEEVETPEVVAARIRRALAVIPPERLVVGPDCGMKYLPRERAFGKLVAMVEGASQVHEG
jgi:5-methyltetrahydropteroyltriglutamate--homocysteine methyltransferase